MQAPPRRNLPIVREPPHAPPPLRLPPQPASPDGRCNNGCIECVTRPLDGVESAFEEADVHGVEVVLRHREATLRDDLPARVLELRRRGALRVALVTNGRLLSYPTRTRALLRAGVDRFCVKLFGLSAESHDAHVRVEGAWAETLRGVEVARALGARVLIAFPFIDGPPLEELAAEQRALAQKLTGFDAIRLPGEPDPEPPPPREGPLGLEVSFDRMEPREASIASPWDRVGVPLVYVNTGPVCNIRCVYCNVDGGDDQRLHDRAYVESVIDAAADSLLATRSASATLELIGGEPTLHPDLAAFVRRARARGVQRVTICTNGVLLLRPGVMDALVEAGLTGLRFSFHDHRTDVANALADVPGLGTRYVDVATALLARRDLGLTFHRMLLARNVDALDAYVDWIAERAHQGLHLGLLLPSRRGRMARSGAEFPPLGTLRDRLARAVERAERNGIVATLHHMPACALPERTSHNAYLHVRTVHVGQGGEGELDFEGDARHGAACASCSVRARCPGLSGAYFDDDPRAAEAWLRPLP